MGNNKKQIKTKTNEAKSSLNRVKADKNVFKVANQTNKLKKAKQVINSVKNVGYKSKFNAKR